MPMVPIDITAIVAIVLGMMVVLIPIAGLTARFAFKPIVEAIAKMRESHAATREAELLERRVALLEQQVQSMERSMDQLVEAQEFQDKLTGPSA